MRQKDRVRVFAIGALIGIVLVMLMRQMRMNDAQERGEPERDQVAEIAAIYEQLDEPWRADMANQVQRGEDLPGNLYRRYVYLQNAFNPQTLRMVETVEDTEPPKLIDWEIYWGHQILVQPKETATVDELANWVQQQGWQLVGEVPEGDEGNWYAVKLAEKGIDAVPKALQAIQNASQATPVANARAWLLHKDRSD